MNSAFANIDILQRKLGETTMMEKSISSVPRQHRREVHSHACSNLTTMIQESLQNAVKSVDDLKVFYKIIEPEALQKAKTRSNTSKIIIIIEQEKRGKET